MIGVRAVTAPNPGSFTLTGTRTYVVGETRVAVVDPGPELPDHLASVAALVAGADSVFILLTHDHADHAEGAASLAARLEIPVHGPGGGVPVFDGDRFTTDMGELVAVATPGHTRDHLCYHLPSEAWVFVGDLLLGTGDTTWIGEYAGGVADYLDSLDTLDRLEAQIFYPGHGPPIEDAASRVERFRRHRLERIDQVSRALKGLPDASLEELTGAVYGRLPESVFRAARSSVEAILDYLESP